MIKKFRNRAVHGGVSFPNEEQANAILLLTRDLLLQIANQASLIINESNLNVQQENVSETSRSR